MIGMFLAMASAAYPSVSTGVSVTTVGGSTARSCYEAAEARDASPKSIADCDAALDGMITGHNLVATHVNRGILKLIQSDFAAADADFDRAIGFDPKQAEAYLNKGISLYQQHKPAAALPLFEQSIALRTRNAALAYYARGLANEDIGNVRAAYADFKRAQTLAPKWNAPVAELARYQVRSR